MNIIVKYELDSSESIFKSFEEIIDLDKVVYLDCSGNRIHSLPKIFSKLTSLQVFLCPGNNIKFLPDELSNLTSLQILCCSGNDLESLPDLSNLTSLQELSCHDNNLKSLPDGPSGLSRLTSLKNLYCHNNNLESLPDLSGLRSLQFLSCHNNKLESLPDLSGLASLEYFHCSYNNLGSLPDLSGLRSLEILDCSGNKLESLPDLSELRSLKELYCDSNNLKSLPLSLLQCRNLKYIDYSNNPIENIPPVLTRFLARLRDTRGRDLKVYSDTQSVHNAAIQECVRKSMMNVLSSELDIKLSSEQLLDEIVSDKILTQKTKESLFEYCRDPEVHSTLNISFQDFLIPVWKRMRSHTESSEMKRIMNIEMSDALCKCFTGRLSRLLNVLNGYYDDVKIEISENDQIANIIYLTRESLGKEYNLETHKELVRKEMLERKYNPETIEIWVEAIE